MIFLSWIRFYSNTWKSLCLILFWSCCVLPINFLTLMIVVIVRPPLCFNSRRILCVFCLYLYKLRIRNKEKASNYDPFFIPYKCFVDIYFLVLLLLYCYTFCYYYYFVKVKGKPHTHLLYLSCPRKNILIGFDAFLHFPFLTSWFFPELFY